MVVVSRSAQHVRSFQRIIRYNSQANQEHFTSRYISPRLIGVRKCLSNTHRLQSMVTSTSSSPALQGLEPQSLWYFFGELSKIPRPSKQEGLVLDWLKQFARERGLPWQQDAVGNIVIRRPGSHGGEKAPVVIIQNHIDMVTEKNSDKQHDFTKDPITLLRCGDFITADGTTLGADNGLGVCTALAVLDMPSSATLPPIEALFTVDEETGLTGAFELDGSMLTGRYMLVRVFFSLLFGRVERLKCIAILYFFPSSS